MATVQAVTTDPGETPVTARAAPSTGASNCAALAVVQGATSGSGPAISAQSANSSAPVISGRGPGTLLDLRDAAGASVLAVGQSGLGAIAAGAVTATSVAASGAVTGGTVAATGALSGAALTVTTIAGTGDATITAGNLILATAGKGLRIKSGGAAATVGTLTLTGATPVVVATTAVTATSLIFLTVQSTGGVPAGIAWVSARSVGVSFSVTGIAADQSVVGWHIVEPI